MSTSNSDDLSAKDIAYGVIACVVALALAIALLIGVIAGFKAFGRYQSRADAHNKVTTSQINANNQVRLTNIQIGTTAQQVKIAQQQAQIRLQNAIGVREAQDEISKTLTPLYVQFEMIDALKEIAASGKNNTVVYIPTGANGVPLISTAAGSQVGLPDATAGK
jgi:hypothetical protein